MRECEIAMWKRFHMHVMGFWTTMNLNEGELREKNYDNHDWSKKSKSAEKTAIESPNTTKWQ